jgi:hypothetical protein
VFMAFTAADHASVGLARGADSAVVEPATR